MSRLLNPIVLGTLAVAAVLMYISLTLFPVPLPGIQLPAEMIHFGPLALPNTFIATLLADATILTLVFFATFKLEMIPSGLQNLLEWVIEGFYGLAEDLGGNHARQFFPWAMTIFLLVTISNWWELVPGFDSIGWLESHPGLTHYETRTILPGLKSIVKAGEFTPEGGHGEDEHAAPATGDDHAAEGAVGDDHAAEGTVVDDHAAEGTGADDHAAEGTGAGDNSAEATTPGGDAAPDAAHGAEAEEDSHALVADDEHHGLPVNEQGNEVAVLVPFLRAAATDLNFTLALALVSVFMTQVFGVQALGLGYFSRFLNFKGGVLGFIVGLIEIISEFSKILSFSFRLFGNIFGGQVLLFVMAFLVPAFLPLPFYGLELFVGVIQGFVFAMLTLVFMSAAVVSHDDHH